MMSPVGMASPFRYAQDRRDVDTIGHPAYWRDALLAVGGFDEALERNSDYEINWRLRQGGDRLVFEPSIVTRYRPRGSVGDLARQFWWYGRWKERVVRQHPRSLRLRHLVPPAAVVAAGLAPILLVNRRSRPLVVLGTALYAGVVAAGVIRARPRDHDADVLVLVACFPVMHASWGAGFLASLLEDAIHALAGRAGQDSDRP
jgi:succinoglycan biosynthesis protein ExoA